MKETSEQVVDLLCDPAINPVEIKDLRCIHHLKKWLAVLPQYRFACKHHAIAHIEEKSNRSCPPRACVESLWGSRWLFRKTPRKFGAGRRSAENQYPRQPCRRLKKSCSGWSVSRTSAGGRRERRETRQGVEIKSLDGKIAEQILADDISHRSVCAYGRRIGLAYLARVCRSFYDPWAAASDARAWTRREAVNGELQIFAFEVWRSCRWGEPHVNCFPDGRITGAARAFVGHLGDAAWTWRRQCRSSPKIPSLTPTPDDQSSAEASAQPSTGGNLCAFSDLL